VKAVVTAGGRIDGTPLGALTGESLKCLIEFDGKRLINHVLDALHATPAVTGVAVVGPPEVLDYAALENGDIWIEDTGSGSGNFLAGVRACADEDRIVFSTSDLPFLEAGAIDALLKLCPEGFGVHYPVFTRDEFHARFPNQKKSQKSYMLLRDGDMTGSSVMIVEPRRMLEHEAEIDVLFNARKNFLKLVWRVGVGLAVRLILTKKLGKRLLSVQQIVDRFAIAAGFPVRAVRGCDPCLGFDIDHERNWAEANAHLQERATC